MSKHIDRARNLQKSIKEILLRDWDPIGIYNIDEDEDEYDAYVSEVYQMLIHRKPAHELFDFLWWVESEHMGLTGNRQKTLAIASKLMEIIKDEEN